MKKKSLMALMICSVILSREASSQGKLSVVTLSPRVGTVITSTERDRFRLFTRIEHFVTAEILESESHNFFAKVEITDKDGAVRDTVFRCPLPLLFNMAEKINHFEEIVQGSYRIGEEPPSLTIGGQKYVLRVLYSGGTDTASNANRRASNHNAECLTGRSTGADKRVQR